MLYSKDIGGVLPAPPPPAPPTGTATVPQHAPMTPAGHVQTSPGYTPDYNALLGSDPGYLAAANAAQQANAQGAAARRAALRQLVIRYGGLPGGFGDVYGDVDQATLDAAKSNQFSALAQMKDNYTKSLDQFQRGLAARGMLQSGELGYGSDQLQRGEAQQEYDAANQFGDQAQGAINQYLGIVSGSNQNLAGAVSQAESNLISNPTYQPVAPTYADYDATSSAQYGQPIYKGEDGSLFTQDGNPFTPPAPDAGGSGGYSDAWYRFHDPTYDK